MTKPYASMLQMAQTGRYAAERAYRDVMRSTDHPERGETVEVVRGRKVPVGTKGKLISTGNSQYGEWVRFTADDGTVHIINASNIRFPNLRERQDAAFEAMEKAKQEYRDVLAEAVAFTGLDLSNPVERGRTQQHAYSDTTESTFAVNPEADDDTLRAVIAAMDPPGSSWGNLRWSGGSSLSNRPQPDRAVICSTTCLCD